MWDVGLCSLCFVIVLCMNVTEWEWARISIWRRGTFPGLKRWASHAASGQGGGQRPTRFLLHLQFESLPIASCALCFAVCCFGSPCSWYESPIPVPAQFDTCEDTLRRIWAFNRVPGARQVLLSRISDIFWQADHLIILILESWLSMIILISQVIEEFIVQQNILETWSSALRTSVRSKLEWTWWSMMKLFMMKAYDDIEQPAKSLLFLWYSRGPVTWVCWIWKQMWVANATW